MLYRLPTTTGTSLSVVEGLWTSEFSTVIVQQMLRHFIARVGSTVGQLQRHYSKAWCVWLRARVCVAVTDRCDLRFSDESSAHRTHRPFSRRRLRVSLRFFPPFGLSVPPP